MKKEEKREAIKEKNEVRPRSITIIGSGFVGKAAGKGLLEKGHDVTFVDINTMLLEKLAKDGLSVCNIGAECANNSEIYLVSVLTPTINEHLDFRFIDSAVASLGQAIKDNSNHPLVVIRSTVPPGTTENRFVPILEQYSGKKVGKDFDVAMNPEFLREVSADEDFAHPWIVVIGSRSIRAAQLLEEIYEPFGAPIVHMTIKEAEMMKYIHNIYNASKISFFNEMREVANAVGADADKMFQTVMESAEAAWNKKYGIRDFGPYDGSCLPKDTQAFLTWADEVAKKKMPLLHSIIKVNENLKEKRYFEY